MYTVTILHGSSCVGKSTIMNSKGHQTFKIEMDECDNWNVKKTEWPIIIIFCLNILEYSITDGISIVVGLDVF